MFNTAAHASCNGQHHGRRRSFEGVGARAFVLRGKNTEKMDVISALLEFKTWTKAKKIVTESDDGDELGVGGRCF